MQTIITKDIICHYLDIGMVVQSIGSNFLSLIPYF